MNPHPQTRTSRPGFTILLLLTILGGMAAPAAATPYTVLIEDPGNWRITGSFDSVTDTWLPGPHIELVILCQRIRSSPRV